MSVASSESGNTPEKMIVVQFTYTRLKFDQGMDNLNDIWATDGMVEQYSTCMNLASNSSDKEKKLMCALPPVLYPLMEIVTLSKARKEDVEKSRSQLHEIESNIQHMKSERNQIEIDISNKEAFIRNLETDAEHSHSILQVYMVWRSPDPPILTPQYKNWAPSAPRAKLISDGNSEVQDVLSRLSEACQTVTTLIGNHRTRVPKDSSSDTSPERNVRNQIPMSNVYHKSGVSNSDASEVESDKRWRGSSPFPNRGKNTHKRDSKWKNYQSPVENSASIIKFLNTAVPKFSKKVSSQIANHLELYESTMDSLILYEADRIRFLPWAIDDRYCHYFSSFREREESPNGSRSYMNPREYLSVLKNAYGLAYRNPDWESVEFNECQNLNERKIKKFPEHNVDESRLKPDLNFESQPKKIPSATGPNQQNQKQQLNPRQTKPQIAKGSERISSDSGSQDYHPRFNQGGGSPTRNRDDPQNQNTHRPSWFDQLADQVSKLSNSGPLVKSIETQMPCRQNKEEQSPNILMLQRDHFLKHSNFLCNLLQLDGRYFIDTCLQDVCVGPIQGLLDTGSQVTILSFSYFQQVLESLKNKPRLTTFDGSLVSVGGDSLQVKGTSWLTYKIGKKTIRHPTLIVDLPYDRLIIGIDLLKRLRSIIDFINKAFFAQSLLSTPTMHGHNICHMIEERPDSVEIHFHNNQVPDVTILKNGKPVKNYAIHIINIQKDKIEKIILEDDVLTIYLKGGNKEVADLIRHTGSLVKIEKTNNTILVPVQVNNIARVKYAKLDLKSEASYISLGLLKCITDPQMIKFSSSQEWIYDLDKDDQSQNVIECDLSISLGNKSTEHGFSVLKEPQYQMYLGNDIIHRFAIQVDLINNVLWSRLPGNPEEFQDKEQTLSEEGAKAKKCRCIILLIQSDTGIWIEEDTMIGLAIDSEYYTFGFQNDIIGLIPDEYLTEEPVVDQHYFSTPEGLFSVHSVYPFSPEEGTCYIDKTSLVFKHEIDENEYESFQQGKKDQVCYIQDNLTSKLEEAYEINQPEIFPEFQGWKNNFLWQMHVLMKSDNS
ncbi:hypothetical protein XELAEV_18005994mg [Xenopus laevis]|uniref:Peptidase A2 domain-containing protein n=1 Tax=Xenopus laevis TaxID=8355 RepID=A0A974DZ19_XENLA|nr:hypothetical protein XELAEV_18005994mg [Xenopus laevis]